MAKIRGKQYSQVQVKVKVKNKKQSFLFLTGGTMVRIVRSIYVYSEFNEIEESWEDLLEHKILIYLNYGKDGEAAVYTPKFNTNLKNREESIFLYPSPSSSIEKNRRFFSSKILTTL